MFYYIFNAGKDDMDILIFKTVNEERFRTLLENFDVLHNTYYIVMPRKEIALYDKGEKNVYYIGTDLNYINYNMIVKENEIPMLKFDEIWVLSSSHDRYYSYNEVYAIISGLRYKGFVYKVISGKCIEDFDIEKKFFRQCSII